VVLCLKKKESFFPVGENRGGPNGIIGRIEKSYIFFGDLFDSFVLEEEDPIFFFDVVQTVGGHNHSVASLFA
jgi:hypothetical protein